MKFQDQKTLILKMERETRKAMRALEDKHAAALLKLWRHAKRDLEMMVMHVYRRDFGRGTWDIVGATQRDTLNHIHLQAARILVKFRDDAFAHVRAALRDIRREETLRHAWMLDQLTPPSFKPRLPAKTMESDGPRDYKATWLQALDNWIASYHDALTANMRLEALHEGSLHDAADEIDATKIGGTDPENKFYSLFSTEAIRTQDDARAEFGDENGEISAGEVFLTLEDDRVCPICDEYDGQPVDDVERPPVHFNCRCYTSIVPRTWADLLANGTPEEQQAALDMEDRGLVPSAMAVRGAHGELVGTVSVMFNAWKKNQEPFVRGGLVR